MKARFSSSAATRRLGAVLALAAFALASSGAGSAAAAPLEGYDGSMPFDCVLQQAGRGTEFPRPDADPFCVEYDKTHQTVSDGGIVDFLANEPARVAAASDKCFYYQRDHWRSRVVAGDERTETYNWDGAYFFDKARGVGGAYAENFTINNRSFDPTLIPGFPDEYRPFFGEGRGGLQSTAGIPIDPRCVAAAEREDPYASQAGAPALRLSARFRGRRLRGGARCARSAVRATVSGPDSRGVARVDFRVAGRRVARDRTRPFSRRIPLHRFRRGRSVRLEAVAVMRDGRRMTMALSLRACAAAVEPRFTG